MNMAAVYSSHHAVWLCEMVLMLLSVGLQSAFLKMPCLLAAQNRLPTNWRRYVPYLPVILADNYVQADS